MTNPLVKRSAPEREESQEDLVRQLNKASRGEISEQLLVAEAEATGLPVEMVREAVKQIVFASAGRDVSGFAARRLVDHAQVDLELAVHAKGGRLQAHPSFLDYESKEGAARRKAWLDFTASARANLAEARKHFLHATILAQHVGPEESARAKDANTEGDEPGTTTGAVHGPAARLVEAEQKASIPRPVDRSRLRKDIRDLASAVAKVEDMAEEAGVDV